MSSSSAQRPSSQIGVTLRSLIPESEYQASLFAEPGNRAELSATMDKLNLKYGHTTLHFAGMRSPRRDSAPTEGIAYSTQIPVKYGVDYICKGKMGNALLKARRL